MLLISLLLTVINVRYCFYLIYNIKFNRYILDNSKFKELII